MLSNRNRARLRRFGMRFFPSARNCRCGKGDCISLALLSTGQEAIITCNEDLRTIERGLTSGTRVTAFRNDLGEPNLVVAVGDARYVLDRRIARRIMVRVS